MPATRRHTTHSVAIALTLGLAAPAALAQDIGAGTTPDGKAAGLTQLTGSGAQNQPSTAAPVAGTLSGDQTAADAPADAETAPAEQATTGSPAATSYALARWVHAIGARICLGPKLNPGDRVSRPDVSNRGQGWRVSVPTFAGRISAPPRRAVRPATDTEIETADTGSTDEPIQTASESGDGG